MTRVASRRLTASSVETSCAGRPSAGNKVTRRAEAPWLGRLTSYARGGEETRLSESTNPISRGRIRLERTIYQYLTT